MLTFGDALRIAREKKGWTQIELSIRCGYPFTSNPIHQWETGRRVPNWTSPQRLCSAVSLPIMELLSYGTYPAPR